MPSAIVNVDGLPFLGAMMSNTATAESVRPMAQQMRKQFSGGGNPAAAQMQETQRRSMIRDTTKLSVAREMGRTSDPVHNR